VPRSPVAIEVGVIGARGRRARSRPGTRRSFDIGRRSTGRHQQLKSAPAQGGEGRGCAAEDEGDLVGAPVGETGGVAFPPLEPVARPGDEPSIEFLRRALCPVRARARADERLEAFDEGVSRARRRTIRASKSRDRAARRLADTSSETVYAKTGRDRAGCRGASLPVANKHAVPAGGRAAEVRARAGAADHGAAAGETGVKGRGRPEVDLDVMELSR